MRLVVHYYKLILNQRRLSYSGVDVFCKLKFSAAPLIYSSRSWGRPSPPVPTPIVKSAGFGVYLGHAVILLSFHMDLISLQFTFCCISLADPETAFDYSENPEIDLETIDLMKQIWKEQFQHVGNKLLHRIESYHTELEPLVETPD